MATTIDLDTAITTAQRFITGKLLESGLTGYVVGLSGGIDSAVSAALAVAAVGKEKVLGVLMPYRTSSHASVEDATAVADKLDIERRLVDISPMVDAYFSEITDDLRIRAGNKMARERMSILFDLARESHRMVLGTGNRTEICLGYTTLFGDSACSINPIGEFYKTEIRQIATRLQLPKAVIEKAPSADLWAGQTDEGEIGVNYDIMDRVLREVVDKGVTSVAALEAAGLTQAAVSQVVSMVNRNAFKRNPSEVAPLGRGEIPRRIQLDT